MKRKNNAFLPGFLVVLIFSITGCGNSNPSGAGNEGSSISENGFSLIEVPDEKKVEVWIDGRFFTAYIYPDDIAKPVLYPLITPSGKVLTRSFPLDTVPGERVDHPHHVGVWLNYGNVNGLDFWNNSYAIPEENRDQYGTIFHRKILKCEGGEDSGTLEVLADWKSPDGIVLLEEHTKFIFSEYEGSWLIDRITTLSSKELEVSFEDNKEGMFGVRVARALELPSDSPEIFMDAHGNPTKTKVLDNTGVNGNYLSSEGIEGGEVWGTRGRWMELYSTIDDENVALVIIDHPGNVGYPTYWHARGYGLFAANPLGQAVFTNGEKQLDFKLAPHESVTLKYRLLVHSGDPLTAESINEIADEFAAR